MPRGSYDWDRTSDIPGMSRVLCQLSYAAMMRAANGDRTHDLPITKRVLYQLS